MAAGSPEGPLDSGANRGAISVLVHPLVVLNVSEHWMREKLAQDSNSVVVYGALVGKHSGREVEIFTSYEALINEDLIVDREYLTARENQCKRIYPGMDLVGWYTTGGPITEEDKLFNSRFLEKSESLIILKLNPFEKSGERLPVRVYETVVGNDSRVDFKQVPYTFAHDAIEHIGVDHLARVNTSASGAAVGTSSGDSGAINGGSGVDEISQTAECLMGNFHAVQMLSSRLHLLRDYVNAVIHGELPLHLARLREIRALVSRLPHSLDSEGADSGSVFSSGGFCENGVDVANSLLRQANDVCLSSLLGGLTRALQSLHLWMWKEKVVVANNDGFMKITGTSGTTAHRSRPTFKAPAPSPPIVEVMASGEDGMQR